MFHETFLLEITCLFVIPVHNSDSAWKSRDVVMAERRLNLKFSRRKNDNKNFRKLYESRLSLDVCWHFAVFLKHSLWGNIFRCKNQHGKNNLLTSASFLRKIPNFLYTKVSFHHKLIWWALFNIISSNDSLLVIIALALLDYIWKINEWMWSYDIHIKTTGIEGIPEKKIGLLSLIYKRFRKFFKFASNLFIQSWILEMYWIIDLLKTITPLLSI